MPCAPVRLSGSVTRLTTGSVLFSRLYGLHRRLVLRSGVIGLFIALLVFLPAAAFTPTFQATIPDVLPDEKDYTRALSLSRLAYDLESLVSPMLAAAVEEIPVTDARMAKNWHGSLWRIALTAEAGRHHRLSIKISRNNFANQE